MALFLPNQLTAEDKRFSMIIYGAPGMGKTTLALSAPNPVLVDFDRGILRVNAAHRKPTVSVSSYDEFLQDIQSDAIKAFETVIIDTGGSFITVMQDWVKRKDPKYGRKDGALALQGYGVLKAEFIRISAYLRDVLNKNIIYVFHSVEEKKGDDTVMRIMCEGSAKNLVWQPTDFGGYVYESAGQHVINFTPCEAFFAKGCFGIRGARPIPQLAAGVPNDFITRLFAEARDNIARETAVFGTEQAAYQAAIARATELAGAVTDPITAQQASEQMKLIKHALTSETEARYIFAARLKELGIIYDKIVGGYTLK
jgi:hypothetical protein